MDYLNSGDTARRAAGVDFEVGDDEASIALREEWYFSRVASIYGGAAEIQRDIVAEHLLGLPKGR